MVKPDQGSLHPSRKYLETLSQPRFEHPASCIAGGHSSKELSRQLIYLVYSYPLQYFHRLSEQKVWKFPLFKGNTQIFFIQPVWMVSFYYNILITTRLILTKQERTIRSISHVLSVSRVLFLRKGNFRFKQTVNIRIQKKCESFHGNGNEKNHWRKAYYHEYWVFQLMR